MTTTEPTITAYIEFTPEERKTLGFWMLNNLCEAVERTATMFIAEHREHEPDRANIVTVITRHYAHALDEAVLAKAVAVEEEMMVDADLDRRYEKRW